MNDVFMKDVVKELRNKRMNDEAALNREIAARDRVDISLEKYEKMRDEIDELKRKNEELKARDDVLGMLLSKLDIPFENLKIKPESIESYADIDMINYGQKNYMIRFKAEEVR